MIYMLRRWLVVVTLLTCSLWAFPGHAADLKLYFLEPKDIVDPVGRLEFRAESLKFAGRAIFQQIPSINLVVPAEDRPGLWAYGVYLDNEGPQPTWSVIRYFTTDGRRYTGPFTVYSETGSGWLSMSGMARNESTGEFLLLRYRYQPHSEVGFSVWAYTSPDGVNWRLLHDRPVYVDHDALGLMWHPGRKEYIAYQTTYENYEKAIPDNLGKFVRRVLAIRTSKDGIRWTPSDPVGLHSRPQYRLATRWLIRPDENDPPDLEFYHMNAFAYGGRYAALVLNYAPSPSVVNPVTVLDGHGPFLSAEWWLSDDGINWRRPYQGQDSLGEASGAAFHAPIITEDEMSFIAGGSRYVLERDRLAGVYSKSNGAFSTPIFVMPDTPLQLNVVAKEREIPVIAGRFAPHAQAYVMAELLDEGGRVIAGYEREKAAFRNVDSRALPLVWDGRDATELAGSKVRLRLYFRDATIYGLTSAARP